LFKNANPESPAEYLNNAIETDKRQVVIDEIQKRIKK